MNLANISTVEGHSFHPTGEATKHQALFIVNPGVPIEDAMESVSDLLSTIDDSIYAAAMGERSLVGNEAWLVKHTLDSARAVVDSLKESLIKQRLKANRA